MDARESKNKAVFNFIKEHKVDVIGFTECNVHWKGVPTADRLEERTRGWFEALHILQELGRRTSIPQGAIWGSEFVEHQQGSTSRYEQGRGPARTRTLDVDEIPRAGSYTASSGSIQASPQHERGTVSVEPAQGTFAVTRRSTVPMRCVHSRSPSRDSKLDSGRRPDRAGNRRQ